ncbi:hypothetical protein AZE42_01254 [Rhizopogon vesiculosus]|uniref:Uncharacterized protein n=1 Tax=Rhizopogon vesiculosus TaxID=180088 RepID=A0A1J8R460_9AGAM|nr:hypothetical protein AZE42_01254 [Rhizopogon vesiculosus]
MVRHGPARLACLLYFLFITLTLRITPVEAIMNKWEVTNFCKCICFSTNYTILPLNTPDNPSKPCLSCTQQWCLNQNLHICIGASLGDTDPDTATGLEGDVEARCFQRDSPRDQLVVTLFLLTVLGLLLGVSIKNRMLKAGLDSGTAWSASRRWWEEWLPRRHPEDYGLRERPGHSTGQGNYREISNTLPM